MTDSVWYAMRSDEVAAQLGVDLARGLSTAEVAQRVERFGRNELVAEKSEPAWRAFLRQYANYMQIMLLVAAALSVIIGQFGTATLLFALTLLNATLGFRQEAKAEASIAALKQMLLVKARVRRDGKVVELPAEELVPGDIVLFEAGDQVPADGRLIRAAALEIEESALTGESQPAEKQTDPVAGDNVPLGDRAGVAYMNTLVTRGSGEMIVTTTGMDTEIGHIATMLQEVESDKSPLQRQIDALTKQLGYIAMGAMAIVIAAGLARGQDFGELFFLATAMAVAAIPTGMPTVVATLLSLGTQALARANAIVKNLTSVETLGSTSAICSDKTGTLTLNKMTAVSLTFGVNRYRVSGVGYSDEGHIQHVGGIGDVSLDPVLIPMALCSDAVIHNEELVGDPTEGALVVLAAKGNIDVEGTRNRYPRLAEVPFDSDYKFMATFHEMTDGDGNQVIRCFVKGAPDAVGARADTVQLSPGETAPFEQVRDRAREHNNQMAAEGLRVLALAQRDFDPATFSPGDDLFSMINGLTMLGMVGIVDPPRPEAREAIELARRAGIRVRMITGDHKVTAGAIGQQLSIPGEAITGADLDTTSDEELVDRINDIGIVGRVSPEHKVRIVQSIQKTGAITAMTGDGVNDAPSLKAADIGIAMGITGTEVSKQAAEMILTDDNFATIVRAVQLGRTVYDNLLKFIRFQLITLFGYIILFIGAAAFNIADGTPLIALQILWINFAIDIALALSLGMDTSASDLMERSPRPSDASFIDRARAIRWTLFGLVMAFLTLLSPLLLVGRFDENAATLFRTLTLTTLAMTHLFTTLGSRNETDTVFSGEMLTNYRFYRKMGLSVLAMIVVTEIGFLQRIFSTTSLTFVQWMVSLAVASGMLWVMEIQKAIGRRRARISY